MALITNETYIHFPRISLFSSKIYNNAYEDIFFFLPLLDLFPNLMDDNGEERESYLEGKSETWLVEVDWQPQHLII